MTITVMIFSYIKKYYTDLLKDAKRFQVKECKEAEIRVVLVRDSLPTRWQQQPS